jgi:hypothetical protein
MIARLRGWWRRRHAPAVVDECCAPSCGIQVAGRHRHVIVERSTDDEQLGIAQVAGGGTGMSATFCRIHCPGGCLLDCPPTLDPGGGQDAPLAGEAS